MSDNGSGNTAIVAIVILVIAAIGFAYYFGVFGGKDGQTTKIIEKPTIIEKSK